MSLDEKRTNLIKKSMEEFFDLYAHFKDTCKSKGLTPATATTYNSTLGSHEQIQLFQTYFKEFGVHILAGAHQELYV